VTILAESSSFCDTISQI